MAGLEDPVKRSAEVYVQGHWEKGGYLRGMLIPLVTARMRMADEFRWTPDTIRD